MSLPTSDYIYLCGPMRGYPRDNFPAFMHAAEHLRSQGFKVWNPAEADEQEPGYQPDHRTNKHGLAYYMKRDVPAVARAGAVYVLPGWEKSEGVCARELVVACWLRLPVYEYITRRRLNIVCDEVWAKEKRRRA